MGIMGPNKRSFDLSRSDLKNLLAVARGEIPADVVLKNIQLLDLVNGEILITSVALYSKWIAGVGEDYQGKEIKDGQGLTIVPGFIDGHVHLESSMMHPFEFERLTLPLGTTTALCDPHEITNVQGEQGFAWFLRCAELMQQNLFVQVSSCIPSLPGFETNGSDFNLDSMKKYRDHRHVVGMAEMMNFPGVVQGQDEVLDKIAAFSGMNLDGHCPLVQGKTLNAYLAAGIQNCHETVTLEEGKEKLQKGMGLIIREGSVAKNLKTLAPLVKDFNSTQCFLCTDDRNPYEIYKEGHINYLVWKLINECGVSPHVAYRLSSFSAAKHFGLKRLGLIAPGYLADFILLEDVRQVKIADVYIGGTSVQQLNLQGQLQEKLEASIPPRQNTMKRPPLKTADLAFSLTPGLYRVIEIIPHEIITKHRQLAFDGNHFAEVEKGNVLKMAVIERHGHQLPPALGLVMGLGPLKGAIASSVAHDSHNLIVIGDHEGDMVAAANALIEAGGGFCVVQKGKVQSLLPLPIAGLISFDSAQNISKGIEDLRKAYQQQGIILEEPFLQMAFLALPVIPSLKLTDKGLVDVEKLSFVDLRVEESLAAE